MGCDEVHRFRKHLSFNLNSTDILQINSLCISERLHSSACCVQEGTRKTCRTTAGLWR